MSRPPRDIGVTPEDLRAWALALPEASEADHHGLASFRLESRIFATLRADPPRLMVKLDPEDQTNFTAAHPDIVTAVPGYWGRKGWTWVDLAVAPGPLVETLLGLAWRRVAPRRLAHRP